jgi:hypothetical protein
MKCPNCGKETQHSGTYETMVGYHSEPGHDHDDNCLKRHYSCVCGHQWTESLRRKCPNPECDWKGKESCWCHGNTLKVDKWSDPEYA